MEPLTSFVNFLNFFNLNFLSTFYYDLTKIPTIRYCKTRDFLEEALLVGRDLL